MKRIAICVLTASILFLCGCGYRIGSLMHPQINTIAIAPVVNETVAYNIAPQVRSLLCETFQQDGSLQLRRESNADCILYARVTSIKFNSSTWSSTYDDENYVPTEWKVTVSIEYSVVIPGDLKPLKKGKASGSSVFMTGADMETGRTNGIRLASYDAAKQIVHRVTEIGRAHV